MDESNSLQPGIGVGERIAATVKLCITVLCLGLVSALLLFAVPRFEAMYSEMGIDLPTVTMALVRMSAIGWVVAGLTAAITVGGAYWIWSAEDEDSFPPGWVWSAAACVCVFCGVFLVIAAYALFMAIAPRRIILH